MNRNSGGMSTGAAILCTLGIMVFIGWIIGLSEPKCSMSGCKNEARDGSRYCYLHDMSYRYYGNPDYNAVYRNSQNKINSSNSAGSSGSNSSKGTGSSSGSTVKESGTSSSSGKKHNSDDSYDKGYDAVYDDGDYDYDRYYRDDDYARGVDDALDDWDEFGEDW